MSLFDGITESISLRLVESKCFSSDVASAHYRINERTKIDALSRAEIVAGVSRMLNLSLEIATSLILNFLFYCHQNRDVAVLKSPI